MGLEILYWNKGVGIEMTGAGKVTGKDICDVLNEIYTGGTLQKQKYQLWDFLAVTAFDFPKLDFDEMVRLDTKASAVNPNIVVAIVGQEDLIFGISRMWESYMEINQTGFETMTFRNRQEAENWIADKSADRTQ